MAIEFGGLDQAHDRGGALAGAQAAGEQPVLPAERNRPDLVFDPVVVDRDLSVRQVARQRDPAFQAVVDGFGAGAAIWDLLPLLAQPGIQLIGDRLSLALA